ncbi:MAG: DUF6291 domain-containing protein [Rikenellaceae bacterium]
MSNDKRESFIFYESFFQAIDKMEIADQLPIYKAITEYALYRKPPDLEGMGAVVWALIQPNLDANWRKWENGRKGGAPKGNANAIKQPKNNQHSTSGYPTIQPNVDVDEDVDVNVDKDVKHNRRTAKRFTPPSFEEVNSYIVQKGYSLSAQTFIDYYTSNGWMVGRTKMKDWRSAINNWARRDATAPGNPQTTQQPKQYGDL